MLRSSLMGAQDMRRCLSLSTIAMVDYPVCQWLDATQTAHAGAGGLGAASASSSGRCARGCCAVAGEFGLTPPQLFALRQLDPERARADARARDRAALRQLERHRARRRARRAGPRRAPRGRARPPRADARRHRARRGGARPPAEPSCARCPSRWPRSAPRIRRRCATCCGARSADPAGDARRSRAYAAMRDPRDRPDRLGARRDSSLSPCDASSRSASVSSARLRRSASERRASAIRLSVCHGLPLIEALICGGASPASSRCAIASTSRTRRASRPTSRPTDSPCALERRGRRASRRRRRPRRARRRGPRPGARTSARRRPRRSSRPMCAPGPSSSASFSSSRSRRCWRSPTSATSACAPSRSSSHPELAGLALQPARQVLGLQHVLGGDDAAGLLDGRHERGADLEAALLAAEERDRRVGRDAPSAPARGAA